MTKPLKQRRGSDRESEILSAAHALLEAKGLVGSSVAEVAALAGVSEATVFSYFRTRRDLMFRVIGDWMGPHIDRLEQDIRNVSGIRSQLTLIAARHLHELVAAPGMYRLIYRELHWEDYYGSALHRLNQRYTKLVLYVIARAQTDGELRTDIDAPIVRDMLFGAFHHIGWRTSMNGRPLAVDEVAAQIVDHLLLGVGAEISRPNAQEHALSLVVKRLERVVDRLSSGGDRQK